jgi:hypothetical protein
MDWCADDFVDECAMYRGDLFLRGEAIRRLHSPGSAVDFVELAILAYPEVAERIDAADSVFALGSCIDELDQV